MTATSGADRKPCGCEGYREHHHGCTKFAGADRPTLREQLAEAMAAEDGERSGPGVDWLAYADALLPVVERAKAEAAAEALEKAAEDSVSSAHLGETAPLRVVKVGDLWDRAADLRSQGGGT